MGYRRPAKDLGGVVLRSASGAQIPLGSIARVEEGVTASSVTRYGGQRQIMLDANFDGKDMGKVVAEIQAYVEKEMPAGVRLNLTGQTEKMKDSMGAIGRASSPIRRLSPAISRRPAKPSITETTCRSA